MDISQRKTLNKVERVIYNLKMLLKKLLIATSVLTAPMKFYCSPVIILGSAKTA